MSPRAYLLLLACLSAASGSASDATVAGNQLMCLGESTTPRFTLTEITWPARPGQAEICLWRDDRYAACSITIDDNNRPDHDWWLALCARLGIQVTFFVITGGVDGANKAYAGTWADWRRIQAAGHDVQSHTVSHGKTGDADPDAETLREYAGSQQAIEQNLPGHRCLALAYPYGKGRPDLAGRLFLAARGVAGVPSTANRINYLNTAIGSAHPDQINAILGRPAKAIAWLDNPVYRRGWIQPLYHFVGRGATEPERQASRAKTEGEIAGIVAERERIWIGTFVHVAAYAQERDSATLTTSSSTEERIVLELQDRMRDDIFDQPLTLKVRLPDAWTGLRAEQGGKPVASRLVQHEGHPYALVQAIPDRGGIVLAP